MDRSYPPRIPVRRCCRQPVPSPSGSWSEGSPLADLRHVGAIGIAPVALQTHHALLDEVRKNACTLIGRNPGELDRLAWRQRQSRHFLELPANSTHQLFANRVTLLAGKGRTQGSGSGKQFDLLEIRPPKCGRVLFFHEVIPQQTAIGIVTERGTGMP